MKKLRMLAVGFGLLVVSSAISPLLAQIDDKIRPVQATLIESGSIPFHLQAVITEPSDPNEHIDVEMFWVTPNKWRRTVKSQEFSQTLIVNGGKVFEQDSADYMPLAIQVLTTALVDPRPIITAVRAGDYVVTKANGKADESGRICFDAAGRMCAISPNGLAESLRGAGRSVTFSNYERFKHQRVARLITYMLDHGDSYQARVMTLGEFVSKDDSQFAIPESTPPNKQIRNEVLSETELRTLSARPVEIIWPQVLEDQNTIGTTSYYISLDRTGQVREILPLTVSIERADDSARRQLLHWKFNPPMKDGAPVQAEGILTFNFDTRAYGPKAILTDEEVRKLASNIVEPEFPKTATPGTPCSIRISVDADGQVIEQIAVDCHGLAQSCMNAIGKWHFSPTMEDGKPRPYRAEIAFRVP
jgi:hypothetical protein